MRNFIQWLPGAAFVLILLQSASAHAEEHELVYDVSLSESETARVAVQLPAGTELVRFPGPSVGMDPDEWEAFFRISPEGEGTTARLERTGPGEWRILNPDTPTAIAYEIDLEFTRRSDWPAGNEHAGAFRDEALYLVGETLFLTPGTEDEDFDGALVRFHLPAEWEATTAWAQRDDGPHAYLVADKKSLVDNALVFGRHFNFTTNVGGFHYSLALVGDVGSSGALIEQTARRIVDSYVELFGAAPQGRYFQAMILGNAEDGEAMAQSSGFRTSVQPTEETAVLWANTLAHELFHKWLASDARIHPTDEDESQWFSEGLAEYYANLTLLRAGIIDAEDWLSKAEKNIGLYYYYMFSPAFSATLIDAGEDKWRNRLAVYNGGWSAAFCLDVLLRSRSEGAQSLDAVMAAMDEAYGRSGDAYEIRDLPAIVFEAVGVDISDVFERSIAGDRFLPVEDCAVQAGLTPGMKPYAGEVYLWPDVDPSEEAVGIRRELFAGALEP